MAALRREAGNVAALRRIQHGYLKDKGWEQGYFLPSVESTVVLE